MFLVAARDIATVAARSVRRRPLPPLTVGLAVSALIALSACAPNSTPSSYNDLAANAFELACTGDAPEYNDTTTTLAGSSYCRCAYAVFVENVPYDGDDQAARVDNDGHQVFASYSGKTYLQYNAEMRDDPNILPDDIMSRLEQCEISTSATAEVPPVSVASPTPD